MYIRSRRWSHGLMLSPAMVAVATTASLFLAGCPWFTGPDGGPSFDAGPGADGGPTGGLAASIFAGVVGHPFRIEGDALVQGGEVPVVSLNDVALAVMVLDDNRLECMLPSDAASGVLRVRYDDGAILEATFDAYRYSAHDVPPTQGTMGAPLALAIDTQKRVFLNEEFHRALHYLDGEEVKQIAIPYPPGPGPFASTVLGDHATRTSILGEDIDLGSDGSVWFTEGGALAYDGAFENHSRVVRYWPDTDTFEVFNIPGDQNEVIGLAYDEATGRVWFAEGRLGQAAIWSFDPELIAPDNTFDFSTSLDEQICAPGEERIDCYTRYPLEDSRAYPSHLAIDREGRVWFSRFWQTSIGVLEPVSGEERTFPLPVATQSSRPFIGSGPWDLALTSSGDLVFNEFFDGAIMWFDTSRYDDGACLSLDGSGENPCVRRTVELNAVPDVMLVHSIELGADGRVWFSADPATDDARPSGIGFVAPSGHAVWLPTIEALDPDAPGERGGQAGIAVDHESGDVYVAEFWRDRIGRFTRVVMPDEDDD